MCENDAKNILKEYLPLEIADTLEKLDKKIVDVTFLLKQNDDFISLSSMSAQVLLENEMRELLSPEIMKYLRALTGKMGCFAVDRNLQNNNENTESENSGGYTDDEIRECILSAISRGARLIGNEFCIRNGKAVLTKEYYKRQNDSILGESGWSAEYFGSRVFLKGQIVRASGKICWTDSGVKHRIETCLGCHSRRDSGQTERFKGVRHGYPLCGNRRLCGGGYLSGCLRFCCDCCSYSGKRKIPQRIAHGEPLGRKCALHRRRDFCCGLGFGCDCRSDCGHGE